MADGDDRFARVTPKQNAFHPHRAGHHHRRRVGGGHGCRWETARRRASNRQVSSLGQNLLTVFAGSRRTGGVQSGLGSASTLTLEDAEAIGREVPDVAAVSPEVTTSAQAIANGRNWSTTIVGESPGLSENPRLETRLRINVHRRAKSAPPPKWL